MNAMNSVLLRCSLLLAGGLALRAQEPARFHDVKGWRGSFVASAKPSPTVMAQLDPNFRSKSVRTRFEYSIISTADFVLEEYESEPSVWKGRATSTYYETSYVFRASSSGGTQETAFSGSGPLTYSAGGAVELQFHRNNGWSVKLPAGALTVDLREHWTSSDGKRFPNAKSGSSSTMSSTRFHPYPEKGYILFASGERTDNYPGVRSLWGISPAVVWEYHIYLEPTSMEELSLEIEETEAYRKWRPDAALDGGPGTPLEIKATLRTAMGGTPKVPIRTFEWELKDTSMVSGIAMNYPAMADDLAYDLELEATGPMSEVRSAKQAMTSVVRSGWSDTVRVVPRDWGGWGSLEVTAHLTDGRQVRGKVKGKKQNGIVLPKRAPNSHIADVWKEKNTSGPDTLDDEADPVGDGNKGDGFSLYEEYRGFIVDGAHVEGDPKAKDFFVRNLIGGDAEPGISLFEALSGFRVHHRLRDTEFRSGDRVMNACNEESHLVDQHGVLLSAAENAAQLAGKPVAIFGAMTYSIDGYPSGKAFRPGSVKIVGILPRGHSESLFSIPGNLPASDAIKTFDRAIAHELMHTVGVVEHGSGDGTAEFNFVAPEDEANIAGRPYFAMDGKLDTPVPLMNELGHDIAAALYPKFVPDLVRWKEKWRWLYVGLPDDPRYPMMNEARYTALACKYLRGSYTLSGDVGAERGEHSGNQDCIMRYHSARFYPVTGRRDAFYLIEPGAERIGFDLCRSAEGTGVNAPGRSPQSRHGLAAKGAGNCAAQICPNDAVPVR